MDEIKRKLGLRVSSKSKNDLDMLLVTLLSAVPFLHFIVSGALLVMIWVALLVFKSTRADMLKQKQLCIIAVAIFLFSTLSSIIAANLIGVSISFGVLVLLTVGAYLITVMNAELFKRAENVVAIGSVVVFFVAAIQRLLGQQRPVAGAFNANYLGAVAALCAVICAVRFFELFECDRRSVSLIWLFAGAFVASAGTILITESRSAQLAFMVCAVAFVFLKKHYVFGAVMAIIAVAIVIVLVKYSGGIYWNSIFDSFYQRADIWKDAFASFTQNPYTFLVGRGPMTYYHVRGVEGLSIHDHAHNLVLDTLLNVGVIGTLLYCILVAYFVKRAIGMIRNGDKTACILLVLMIAEVIVQGIPDVTIMWHQSAMLFLISCAAVFKTNQ